MTDTETILQELRLLRKQVEKLTATMLPSETETREDILEEFRNLDSEAKSRYLRAKFGRRK